MGYDAHLALGENCPDVKCPQGILCGILEAFSGHLFWEIFRVEEFFIRECPAVLSGVGVWIPMCSGCDLCHSG